MFCSWTFNPFTLKGMETSLNLATCAAMSSLMFSCSRHLSAALGGGAARRPAWACMMPETVTSNKRTRSFFMGLILAALNSHFGIATHENVLIHLHNPILVREKYQRNCPRSQNY